MASAKAIRLLNVFKALDGHPIIGVSNKELASGLSLSPVDVSRDLADLISAGLVQKLENGRYAYSIKTLQIAERYRRQVEYLKSRLDETEQRVNKI